MSVRELVVKAPYLCGASDASSYSKIAEMIFDSEKENADSPFKRSAKDVDDPLNRVKFAFMFNDGDEGKKSQCMRLARIAELTHYKVCHKDNSVNDELDALVLEAVDSEVDYPDVAQVMTVDQAADVALAAGGW